MVEGWVTEGIWTHSFTFWGREELGSRAVTAPAPTMRQLQTHAVTLFSPPRTRTLRSEFPGSNPTSLATFLPSEGLVAKWSSRFCMTLGRCPQQRCKAHRMLSVFLSGSCKPLGEQHEHRPTQKELLYQPCQRLNVASGSDLSISAVGGLSAAFKIDSFQLACQQPKVLNCRKSFCRTWQSKHESWPPSSALRPPGIHYVLLASCTRSLLAGVWGKAGWDDGH